LDPFPDRLNYAAVKHLNSCLAGWKFSATIIMHLLFNWKPIEISDPSKLQL